MGWYNNGNWDGVPVARYGVILKELKLALYQRTQMYPFNENASQFDWGCSGIPESDGVSLAALVRYVPTLQRCVDKFVNSGAFTVSSSSTPHTIASLLEDNPYGSEWLQTPDVISDPKPFMQLRYAIEKLKYRFWPIWNRRQNIENYGVKSWSGTTWANMEEQGISWNVDLIGGRLRRRWYGLSRLVSRSVSFGSYPSGGDFLLDTRHVKGALLSGTQIIKNYATERYTGGYKVAIDGVEYTCNGGSHETYTVRGMGSTWPPANNIIPVSDTPPESEPGPSSWPTDIPVLWEASVELWSEFFWTSWKLDSYNQTRRDRCTHCITDISSLLTYG